MLDRNLFTTWEIRFIFASLFLQGRILSFILLLLSSSSCWCVKMSGMLVCEYYHLNLSSFINASSSFFSGDKVTRRLTKKKRICFYILVSRERGKRRRRERSLVYSSVDDDDVNPSFLRHCYSFSIWRRRS